MQIKRETGSLEESPGAGKVRMLACVRKDYGGGRWCTCGEADGSDYDADESYPITAEDSPVLATSMTVPLPSNPQRVGAAAEAVLD
jgi:hypothetical protein